MLGELSGREFAALDVACVDLRKMLPLFRQVIQRENRGHRADRHTGATVDALDGINVELRDFVEAGTAIIVGRALLGVDAIYGAGIDAGGVLHPDAGLGNDVRHRPPPFFHAMLPGGKIQEMPGRTLLRMALRVEKISAVTLKVASMRKSVRFYKDVLGMEIVYGGEDGSFSSLRPTDDSAPILNLEQGRSVTGWGRMIFYVSDVDAFWEYLRGKGFNPERPRDASWGERYFHMPDPDGHELSFARLI